MSLYLGLWHWRGEEISIEIVHGFRELRVYGSRQRDAVKTCDSTGSSQPILLATRPLSALPWQKHDFIWPAGDPLKKTANEERP
mmetsp:Transcript_54243/g.118688  ORF Transcript_54243/g.118688 Transcript_54243/m.118688 type:complete len:84 (+) Transcript_54243:816-1067(+)